ncbi:MAG: GHKL domain-containing protein [Eggerthellaceae bacterium]|nr:GHKL domain-containing protein [Eggerthellaceae bacterium]
MIESVSFFARHALGFFLQLAPCSVLCFLPFLPPTLRFSKERTLACVVVAEALMALVFPLFIVAFDEQQLAANLYMLAAVLLLAMAYFALVREALAKKLLVIVLVMFYAFTQYCAVVLLLPFLNGGNFSDETYTARALALWAVTTAVMFPVGVAVSLKVVRDYLREIEPANMGRDFVAVMVVSVGYFAVVIGYNTVIDYSRPDQVALFAPLLLLLFVQEGLAWWLLMRESVRRKRDGERQKALEIQRLQYDNIMHEMESARRMRHDMRHYLGGLANLLDRGALGEARAYLGEVARRGEGGVGARYCENAVVNGLLQHYVGLAEDEGVRCDVQAACDDVAVSAPDLTVMIGNAMENAVRACTEMPEGERWLRVRIGVIGGSMAVQIENPCREVRLAGARRASDGFLPAAAFASTRQGGGLGLASIERAARAYDGEASFRFDEPARTFTTRIRVNASL